jgi:hypothetical protein
MLRNKHEGRLDGGAAAVETAFVLRLHGWAGLRGVCFRQRSTVLQTSMDTHRCAGFGANSVQVAG